MIEPFSAFILTTAAGVLSGCVTDMIRGGRRAALQRELEGEISKAVLRNKGLTSDQVGDIVQRVVDEVKLLAIKNPDLRALDDRIELVRSPHLGLPFHRDARIERELSKRLHQLQETVAARRHELGLPLTIAESEATSEISQTEAPKEEINDSSHEAAGSGSDSPRPHVVLEWEGSPETPSKDSSWLEEIGRTKDRVHRRRLGEKVDD